MRRRNTAPFDRPSVIGRVLVTGATGFVGRHLVRDLKARGIEVVDDGRRDIGAETEWTDALAKVHTVVHLAALAHERASTIEASGDHEVLREVNALGAERLAQAAATAGVRHIIFTSTIGVCGDETSGTVFNEESPPAPRSLYAASKLEAERRLATVAAEEGLRLTILRPTLVYGAENGGNMLRLLRLVDRGWPLPFASIDNRRSLLHVHNLVSAIFAALTQPHEGGIFVVCDDLPISTPDIIRCISAGMGRSARLFACPEAVLRVAAVIGGQQRALRGLIGSLEADSGKFSRLLGWRPPMRVQDGLYETGRWFCSSNARAPSG